MNNYGLVKDEFIIYIGLIYSRKNKEYVAKINN